MPGPSKALVFALPIVLVSPALAADAGEVALAEDTDGAIKAAAASTSMYLQKAACAFFKGHPQPVPRALGGVLRLGHRPPRVG
ncbi:MAG: hypothetical protein HY897_15555 [Deltaproteobacteria bacterium]|nr:hypothetical protein [Deltaproteobacteria bacterium]